MKVIAYRMFSSSEDFEKWQQENRGKRTEPGIISISPMVSGVEGKHEELYDESTRYDFSTSVNVFVTYFKEV